MHPFENPQRISIKQATNAVQILTSCYRYSLVTNGRAQRVHHDNWKLKRLVEAQRLAFYNRKKQIYWFPSKSTFNLSCESSLRLINYYLNASNKMLCFAYLSNRTSIPAKETFFDGFIFRLRHHNGKFGARKEKKGKKTAAFFMPKAQNPVKSESKSSKQNDNDKDVDDRSATLFYMRN